ncbi:MAG: hypothetical protein COV35_10790 [Alphaproteobacteria bacterium CG11_big_fil_rev_8_21_14_0_20_39_49]|nr:MAG: hypothetical protein COV35_10790 [Alphaproteobacteria bacterium CG11_big_fil_rev_8_21_14_0_20_39_49]
MLKTKFAASAALITMLSGTSALAASDKDIEALRAEIQNMKKTYEGRIAELESKLSKVEQTQAKAVAPAPATPATARRDVKDNSFNPSIGVILNGQYSQFSSDEGEIAGFAVGHEGERPREGFAVDHTEINFSANVDDKFFGSTTAAIAQHEGETEIELEEAFIQTLPGVGLPNGMSVKAGRAFWTLGYLNEHHRHADDFADRPLPYRAFLNEAFNDDGAQISYVLPTDFYSEIGGGLFRGDDFPFGEGDGEGIGAWSAFARVGGDIGDNQSWRLGGYILSGEADGSRLTNEDMVSFTGDTDIYAADIRYTWAPTGNARNREVILQGEYFWRNEDGIYEDTDAGTGAVNFDDSSSGWYAQGVYKFAPQWRVGLRYSQLEASDIPVGLAGSALDSEGYDPKAYSTMLDWTNSEFSRVRLQYNREELARGQDDDQIMVQYIMSLGAHGAHKY